MTLGYMEDTAAHPAQDAAQCQRIKDVLARVGDRWSVMIVITLDGGTMRFNELKRHLGITQRMLSLTLKELERDGLISRTYHPTIPPKVEYALTPLGKSFSEPVRSIGRWAIDNLTNIDVCRQRYDAAADTPD
ncbi:putative HTH-type transcriptional regulator YybR [Thalassovita gelatinovora]|uniref:Putative HTH-type transcriptional regulator YybR n=1 Tax=Thalassovita gelatinovora TaxID=53501 RepID=A0A0P1FJS7_THAGE|nr:helix-turn-helix domain-containing protein [Thalassovita gelatinovora]QIZ81709.1 helix-turn-helix transcriptional regulator [Thalassovita gelatinovora]CUH68268.1 putative HTH-type transcriptional regulator YybR [Thalassovita gelatinovora]SEQ32417.1 transcriptional regulator, HxlR family [Thalassovita gelatinovora]